MSINKPVKNKTRLAWSPEIYVAARWSDTLQRVGVYKDHEISFGGETVEDVYSNYTAKKSKNSDKLNISFALSEQRPEIMEIINKGTIQKTEQTNTLIAWQVDQFFIGEWGFDFDILLSKYNADGSLVTINSISINKSWTITNLTAEDFVLSTNAFGMSVIKFVTGNNLNLWDEDEGVVTVNYDVTPANATLLDHTASGVEAPFVCLIQWKGVDANGDEMKMVVALDEVSNEKSFTNFAGDSDDSTAVLNCNFSGRVVKHEFYNF